MRKAVAEVDAAADPVRAAFLLERLGHYLRWAGETEEGFAAYDAAMALLPPGDGVERARLMEHLARGKVLRGENRQATREAEEALAMAERVGAEVVIGRALNTLGLCRSALGSVDEGIALLRRARDRGAELGPPVEHVLAASNLSDVLDRAGRTEEALAEVRACMEVVRLYPERTNYDTFLELQGVSQLIRLGRLSEIEPGLPTVAFGDRTGSTPIYLAELRARLGLLTGDLERAECEIGELRRLTRGTRDPQWLEPLAAPHGAAGLAARSSRGGACRRRRGTRGGAAVRRGAADDAARLDGAAGRGRDRRPVAGLGVRRRLRGRAAARSCRGGGQAVLVGRRAAVRRPGSCRGRADPRVGCGCGSF